MNLLLPCFKIRLLGLILVAMFVVSSSMAADAKDFSQGLTNQGSPAAATDSSWQKMNENAAKAAEELAAKAAVAAGGPAADGSYAYTLGAGDRIRLTVFGEEDLSGEFDVDSTGEVALPLIGEIQAGGKTPRALEKAIMEKLSQGYLVQPRVSLEVMNFRPFFILGEVNKPGSYPYVNDMTVISAVALAGGYTPRAVTGSVLIKRVNDPARREVEVADDAKVYPGDIIRVEERFF